MKDYLGYEKTYSNTKTKSDQNNLSSFLKDDCTPAVPGNAWLNGDVPVKKIPEDEKQRQEFYLQKGRAAAQDWLGYIHFDDFKSQVGSIFDEMVSGGVLNLDQPLWASFIKQKFIADENLEVPGPYELMNTETEFWEMGFQRELKRVLKHALTWK